LTRAKKIPGRRLSIRDFPVYPQISTVFSLIREENSCIGSGRSSDFSTIPAAFPSGAESGALARMFPFFLMQERSGITAAGPSPIRTGFPFHPPRRNLNDVTIQEKNRFCQGNLAIGAT
jgi:hypothetical protein